MDDILNDCIRCSLKYCPPECFNKHEGSMIALGKLVNKIEDEKKIKIHIVADRCKECGYVFLNEWDVCPEEHKR